MKKLISLFLVLMFLLPAALAEEEIVEDVMLDDEGEEVGFSPDGDSSGSDQSVFTPSYGSEWQSAPGASAYWTLPMDITNEEAVWNMLMEPITIVDIGKVKNLSRSQMTKKNIYMYREPDENSKIVGEVTNLSQGLRVIEQLDNGWTHVECYSSSFFSKPATKIKAWNILVSGYVESRYLKQVQPTDELALVVDKLTQRLYVFQKGKRIAELLCSTGLVQWNGKKYQPYNETRSGEFLLINMTGSLNSDKLKCSYAIRFNAGDEIHEVPHQVRGDGSYDYRTTEPSLGQKKSHGCIRVQRLPTPEGINMAWIYKKVRDLDLCGSVKIVIWEDWQGRQIPVPDPDTILYYNDNGKGQYYHRCEKCESASSVTFSPFRYAQLDEAPFSKLQACPWCVPVRRESDIDEINQRYAPGGDHDELLTELRQEYYDYLEND
jgi:hypothetical protein